MEASSQHRRRTLTAMGLPRLTQSLLLTVTGLLKLLLLRVTTILNLYQPLTTTGLLKLLLLRVTIAQLLFLLRTVTAPLKLTPWVITTTLLAPTPPLPSLPSLFPLQE